MVLRSIFKIYDTIKVTGHFKENDIFYQNTYIEVFIPGENSNFEVSDLAGLPGPRNTVNSGKSL